MSRADLRAAGIDRFVVRDLVAANRWRLWGRQTVCVHPGELSDEAARWRAIFEVGTNIAAVDGISALVAAGVTYLGSDVVHVAIPHGCRPLPVHGVRLHQVCGFVPEDVVHGGLPRVRPEIAAIHAAQWAVSDRQAALYLCVGVQQRVVRARELLRAARRMRGGRRRRFILAVVADLADGAQSLGELDFARHCRDRGLPEPSRQVVRHGPRGRVYLDVRWDGLGLVVEIDGSQHRQGLNVADDNLRQNAVVLSGDVVLRIDLIGLRLYLDRFMDQVCEAHRLLSPAA